MIYSGMKFPVLLRGAWFGINRAFRQKLRKSLITPVQYTVLRNLIESGGSVSDQQNLANMLSTNKNNLADLINRMEEINLVHRHGTSSDLRRKKVSITSKGRKEFLRSSEYAADLERAILSQFSDKQKSDLFSSLTRCNEKLDELK